MQTNSIIVSDDRNAVDASVVTAVSKTYGSVTPTALTVWGVCPSGQPIACNFLTEESRDEFYKTLVDAMQKKSQS